MKNLVLLIWVFISCNTTASFAQNAAKELQKYLETNMNYPNVATSKRTSATAHAFFLVNERGGVERIRAEASVYGKGFVEEIQRVLFSAPTFSDLSKGMYLVRFEFVIPLADGTFQPKTPAVDTLLSSNAIRLPLVKVHSSGKLSGNKTDISDNKNRIGIDVLFSGVSEKLTSAQKEEIFQQLKYKLMSDKKSFYVDGCESESFQPRLFLADINGDRIVEVVVVGGNLCTSGITASNVTLFIKDVSGKYRKNLGFEGVGFDQLPTKRNGYPDLWISGRGMCRPVWRWSGTEYQFYAKKCE